MSNGKCVIVSAPSGAGKTTIVKRLLAMDLSLEFSISATSRPKRGDEVDEKDYYFLSPEAFKQKIKENAFIEWEEVYPDQYYGTLKSEIQRIWDKKNVVIFDVDVIGGLNLKKIIEKQALSVFIQPPNIEALRERLTNRRTETPEKLKLRLDKAAQELSYANQFDKIVINDVLEKAVEEAKSIIVNFTN